MRTALYNFSILILRLLLPILAKVSAKAKLFYAGRKQLIQTIKEELKDNNLSLFWMHCSSVGEFEQGLPVLELLKKQYPTWKVVVTFFSPSGYEAVNHTSIDYKYYLPIDTSQNAKQFVTAINPQLALFIKYEYWHHFLSELNKNNIPTFSVSSILRPTQTFFKWYGGWNRKMLMQFTYFMVQDQPSLQLLKSIGLNNAQVTGDTRFDRVLKIKEDTLRYEEIEHFIKGKKVFIIGSLRPEDDDTIIPFIKAHKSYVFIIAPHDINEKHMAKIEASVSSVIRHSQLPTSDAKNVLIIDSIGKLSRLYRLADFAYVGGGFSDGIHNILEPAVYNIPVFFGNKHFKKYKEALDLVKLKSAFAISGSEELAQTLKKINNPQALSTISTTIENYIDLNRGAAQKVIDIINQNMK